MSSWRIEIHSNNLRKASVEKLVKHLNDELKESMITITDIKLPSSRSERFSAAMALVEEGKSEFECLRDELQDWYDNLPEQFQSGDKGEQLETAVSSLEDAISSCEDACGAEVEFPGMY